VVDDDIEKTCENVRASQKLKVRTEEKEGRERRRGKGKK